MKDNSQFFGVVALYSMTDEFSIALGGQLFLGDDFAEYWYYPDALYLKADFFFKKILLSIPIDSYLPNSYIKCGAKLIQWASRICNSLNLIYGNSEYT